jgi:hypothetical protein
MGFCRIENVRAARPNTIATAEINAQPLASTVETLRGAGRFGLVAMRDGLPAIVTIQHTIKRPSKHCDSFRPRCMVVDTYVNIQHL